MAQGKQALKSRIRSINATKKITSAMELISNSKLVKQRNMMEKNREYAMYLKDTLAHILMNSEDVENQWLLHRKSEKKLTILFTSDLGLCGGYNSNMLKMVLNDLNPEDPIILIGSKGTSWLSNHGFTTINDYVNSDNCTFQDLAKLADNALSLYQKDEIGAIQVLYTKFVNAVTFTPVMEKLLPISRSKETEVKYSEIIFEPNADSILDQLIPMAIRSLVYSSWLQTKTAEQGSRRIAMENATDNAEELKEKLVLQYNQARQAEVTQEISEIVAGADAI